MNCKPGDLAVIVRSFSPDFIVNVGRIVRVGNFYGKAAFKSGYEKENCWLVHGRLMTRSGAPFDRLAREHGADGCIPDDHLCPIRDPGDDAVDEMVQKLGKPEGITA